MDAGALFDLVRLEAIQRREQRARLDLESAVGDLCDAICDSQPMKWAKGKRSQDQEIEVSIVNSDKTPASSNATRTGSDSPDNANTTPCSRARAAAF